MKIWKRLLGVFLVLCILVQIPAAEMAAAAVPSLEAPVTEANVMALLNKYDKDGAYLIKKTRNSGGSFLNWFTPGRRIVADIDTAVHEQCHAFMTGYDSINVYIGNKKSILVDYTDVYRSRLMAASVPEKCRTFRFSTYVSQASPNLASDVCGAYGLLNEFTAYSWGMNNTVSLFSYYSKYPATMDTWRSFINMGANDRMAYAEFNYYILHYLWYAKQHYPKVYKGVLNNKNFRKAYKTIESKFRKNIAAYEKDLNKIIKKVEAAGGYAFIRDGYFFINGSGTGIFTGDYETLLKEVKKSKYRKIYKKLIK